MRMRRTYHNDNDDDAWMERAHGNPKSYTHGLHATALRYHELPAETLLLCKH